MQIVGLSGYAVPMLVTKGHSLVLFVVLPHNTRLCAPPGMKFDPRAARLSVADERDELEQGARLHYADDVPSSRVSERRSPIISVMKRLDIWWTFIVEVEIQVRRPQAT